MRVIEGDTRSFDCSSNDASILGLTSTNDMRILIGAHVG